MDKYMLTVMIGDGEGVSVLRGEPFDPEMDMGEFLRALGEVGRQAYDEAQRQIAHGARND